MEQKLFNYMHKEHEHKYHIVSPSGEIFHIYKDGSIIKDTTLKLPPLK